MKTVDKTPFGPNLSITEIFVRHYILMIVGIAVGVLKMPALILLGLPFFMTAMTGWCPIYELLGINNHN